MAERGLDISNHRARLINEDQLQEADLVLCMETGHVEALRAEFPVYADKIYLLTEMIGNQYSISDPYGGPLKAYQSMIAELTQIIDKGLDQIIALAEANAGPRS